MITRHITDQVIPENIVKELLKQYNIPVPDYMLLSAEDSIESCNFSFPVALKVCTKDILHKTDVGGVRLNILDCEELKEAVTIFRSRFPGESMVVESMVPIGMELIMGLVDDPSFGLAIMVGVGGVFTEIINDISFRLVPISERDANDMLDELHARVLFDCFRGVRLDRKAVIMLLLTLSKMSMESNLTIRQMDLNPVYVYEENLMVVDAKLIVGDQ